MAGLAGVMLIVWHKIDGQEATAGSLIAVSVALFGVTAGSLYQRTFCPRVDLRAAKPRIQTLTNPKARRSTLDLLEPGPGPSAALIATRHAAKQITAVIAKYAIVPSIAEHSIVTAL